MLASLCPLAQPAWGVASNWAHLLGGADSTTRQPGGHQPWSRLCGGRTCDIRMCQPACEVTLENRKCSGAKAPEHSQTPAQGCETESWLLASGKGRPLATRRSLTSDSLGCLCTRCDLRQSLRHTIHRPPHEDTCMLKNTCLNMHPYAQVHTHTHVRTQSLALLHLGPHLGASP